MMELQENSPQARSWRDIPQEVKPRAMSRTGRRRYLMSLAKIIGGTMLAGLASWGIISLVATIENNPRQLARATQAAPVAEISAYSDGVLGREWVSRVLGLPKAASLMELDLAVLQARLEASGQVRSAVLVKNFPSTLSVRLSERAPVARVMAEEAPGRQVQLFVARDGVAYKGEGYDLAFSDSLPWLSGVRLARRDGVLQPIEGMDTVAELLAKAKYEAEHLYPLFQVVNLARLKTDGAIEVSSPEFQCIVFSTKEDFFQQMALLDSIRDTLRPTRQDPLAKVDLSLGRDVPVSYMPPVSRQTPGAKSAAKSATSEAPARKPEPLFFNFQRTTTNREL